MLRVRQQAAEEQCVWPKGCKLCTTLGSFSAASRQLLGNTVESKEAFNVCRLWRWSLGPSGRPPLLAG